MGGQSRKRAVFGIAASNRVVRSAMRGQLRIVKVWSAFAATLLACLGSAVAAERTPSVTNLIEMTAMTFRFERQGMDGLGARLFADGNIDGIADGTEATFAIQESSRFALRMHRGSFIGLGSGRAGTRGAFLVQGNHLRDVIGTLTLVVDKAGIVTVVAAPDSPTDELTVFDVESIVADLDRSSKALLITGELFVSESWADAMFMPDVAGLNIGTLWLEATWATVDQTDAAPAKKTLATAPQQHQISRSHGSDVVIADLQSVGRYGREGDITAYAVGTHACNLGDEEANWIKNTNQHPVIVQNMYRLKNDKLEQIGLSWVKHGFYAVSFDLCGACNDPTPEGSHLAVGCSDPYSASLNGVQGNMSPTSTVNAHTGNFPYPWSGWNDGPASNSIERRLQVHDADLEPSLNQGAVYFVQGQYVMADDAAAGTHDNNASYREVDVTKTGPGFFKVAVSETSFTQRGQPAIRAWKDRDPSVEEVDVRVPGEGLMILAGNATDLGTGLWRYAYALENLNSDRCAGSFSVPLPSGVVVSNIGFHDVDYHSGDPFDPTDWPGTASEDAVTWATESFSENPNANAIRFGTLYDFYFDANVEPAPTTVTIGLFKPGFPDVVQSNIVGPKLAFIDCNRNGVMDVCDVSCQPYDDEGRPMVEFCAVPEGTPCGTSNDCNGNQVPDECEPDCNSNGVADSCDITRGTSSDCNENSVPDDCEPDCDGNGVADDCEVLADSDEDGIVDCYDRCRFSTPRKTCNCPPYGECCFPPELGGICTPEPISPEVCLEFGAIPDCLEQPCRQGCVIGDFDGDGDLDLADLAAFQHCIGLDVNQPGYEAPIQECSIPLDFDDDDDVDMRDVQIFFSLMNGPEPEER